MTKTKIRSNHFTASDGEQLHYYFGGDKNKKTIIFLHGLGGSGKEYFKIAKKLAPEYRVIMPDYRGHGKSKRTINFSQKRTAQDLNELIDLLGLKDVMLVGMSLGVHIIFRYITEYGQDSIRSIALIDMSPKLTNNSSWKWGYSKGTYTEDMLKDDIIDMREDVASFKQRVYVDFINYLRKDNSKIDRPNFLHKAVAMLLFPQIIVDTWEDLFLQDYRELLSEITLPCAIIYGNPGSIYSEGTAKYMSSKIKNSELFAFNGVRHENMLKQTDEVMKIVRDYAY